MMINRREFLKAATAAGCLVPLSGISNLSFGATSQQPLLVALFLRGGADGLHMVGPTADADYVAARPPELRVLGAGEQAGRLLDNSIAPTAGFRFHHEAKLLADLYQAGRLAVIHAVGIKGGTRSHFVAQDMIERGIGDEFRVAQTNSGWLARATSKSTGLVTGYSATTSPAFALQGLTSSMAIPDLSGGIGVPWGGSTTGFLRALSAAGDHPIYGATRRTVDLVESIDKALPRDAGNKVLAYASSGKTSYEGAGDLTRSLGSLARLAKMDVGLASACIDFGGWDTHEGQPGAFAAQMKRLSQGMMAFNDDMAGAGRKVVVVVMTEFGRRLRANKSNGTDHGHGGCWFVMGDGVVGGRMYGAWPGLGTAQLDRGVDLAVTTDYRIVLSEALVACGLNSADAFPDWPTSQRLGIFPSQSRFKTFS